MPKGKYQKQKKKSSLAFYLILFILIAIFTAVLFATSKGLIFYEGDDKE